MLVFFCYRCNGIVPNVTRPDWTCVVCLSAFVDEIDQNAVPLIWARQTYQRVMPATPQNLQTPFPGRRVDNRLPFPLPPRARPNQGLAFRPIAQVRRPQMFVTHDGRIVDRQRAGYNVPTSESELKRRIDALITRPFNAEFDETDCSICLDEHLETYSQLPCQHKFHFTCIKLWLEQKNACPLCNQTVAP